MNAWAQTRRGFIIENCTYVGGIFISPISVDFETGLWETLGNSRALTTNEEMENEHATGI